MDAASASPLLKEELSSRTDEAPFLLRRAGGDEGGTIVPGMLCRSRDGDVEFLPIVHPERPRPQRDVVKAWRHFRTVLKDKEQTDQIVAVIDALPWREVNDEAAAFLATPKGQAIYRSEPYLPDLLDDHEALRRTVPGSFAHAYCDFMERENLSAAGMVAATSAREDGMLDDGVRWYVDRLRDFHDILHIVTGYGRDLLGEQCIFAFMYHQRPSPGHLALAWAGTLMMKAKLHSKAPIIGALREARQNGKSCPRIVEMPIMQLFEMRLDDVRRLLNVRQPRVYQQVLKIWEAEGIDPHAFLAKQDAEPPKAFAK